MNSEMWTLIGTVVTALITGLATYRVATVNANKDIEVKKSEFIDQQIKMLLNTYQTELTALRADIAELMAENHLLREEIIELKQKLIELGGDDD